MNRLLQRKNCFGKSNQAASWLLQHLKLVHSMLCQMISLDTHTMEYILQKAGLKLEVVRNWGSVGTTVAILEGFELDSLSKEELSVPPEDMFSQLTVLARKPLV
jgi:hypothetical protein